MEKSYTRRKPVTGRDGKPARARRTAAGRSYGEKKNFGEKRSYSDAEDASEKRSFSKKTHSAGRSEDGRYEGKKSYGDRKPYGEKKQYGERKTYGERKSYGDKPFGGKSYGERKPYGAGRSYGDRPYDRKPYGEKTSYGDKSYGEKSYGNRKYSDRKAFSEDRYQSKYVKKDYKSVKKEQPYVERPENQEYVRLNKLIANSGICSRREADEFIQTGLVTVNGERVTELGRKVRYDDDVRFNGERVKGEQKVYLVMNKPKDYVTTLSDPHADKTVMDLISAQRCPQRIYPVGRLDKATTGVLMFTNDGELTEKLTHPAYGARKIYHVFLDKNLKKSDFDAILEGIELEDGEIHADSLSYVDDDMAQVGVEIHSGRNRIVRRIFEHFGYNVRKLDRVYFAGLTKKALKRGEWRFLTESEVNKLKMGSFE